MEREMAAIAATGLDEILLLTGECRKQSGVAYIGQAVAIACRFFGTVGVEIYPLNTDEYALLRSQGADFVNLYQETYQPALYGHVHVAGPKRCYPYRFHAHERALEAGLRGVSLGVLLGLGPFCEDAFAAGVHGFLLQKKFPMGEISFSVPRLRAFGDADNALVKNAVSERQLLQVMLALRLFMPHVGLAISTRERAGFRDNVVGLCATKMSAGVMVGVGGHESAPKGGEQFDVADARSVAEIHRMLGEKGLQPVYTDYIRV